MALFGLYFGLGTHVIVIGHVVVSLPFVILTSCPGSNGSARRGGGRAGPGRERGVATFRRVTVPLLMPAIVSAFLIAFTLSFDEYAIASFVAGDVTTYPLFLYSQVRIGVGLPQMIAISVMVMVVSMLLVFVAELARRRAERRLDVPTPSL